VYPGQREDGKERIEEGKDFKILLHSYIFIIDV
jgi:hypothetical protein